MGVNKQALNLVIRTGADLICIDKKIVEVEELVHTCHLPRCHTHSLPARAHVLKCCITIGCAAGPLPPDGGPEQQAGGQEGIYLLRMFRRLQWLMGQCHRAFLPCCLPSKPTITWNWDPQDKFLFFSPPCLAPVQATPKKRARISLGQRRKTASA
jgi:hypothetical protein